MEDSTREGTAMKKRTNKEIEETGGSIVDCFAYVVVDVTLWYVDTYTFVLFWFWTQNHLTPNRYKFHMTPLEQIFFLLQSHQLLASSMVPQQLFFIRRQKILQRLLRNLGN